MVALPIMYFIYLLYFVSWDSGCSWSKIWDYIKWNSIDWDQINLFHSKDRVSSSYATINLSNGLAVGIFSLGVILVNSQWFSSSSIVFSDTQTRINKIQNLYQKSIDSAREKDTADQKKFLISAIHLTENAIKRSPLDSGLILFEVNFIAF